jgi:hypothetical protein
LGRYAELTFVPWRLCADHTYADVMPSRGVFDAFAGWSWLGLVLLIPLLYSGIAAMRGRGYGLGFAFLLSYLLVGQWVIDIVGMLAERIALWPSIWLVFALSVLYERLAAKSGSTRLRTALVSLLFIAFAAKTVIHTLNWRNNVSLFTASATHCPKALHNRFNLAQALSKAGRHEEAVWNFGLTGAMRALYPHPFEMPAFDIEHLPVTQRLRRLPELTASPDPIGFWIGLHGYLKKAGFTKEVRVVDRLLSSSRNHPHPELSSLPEGQIF